MKGLSFGFAKKAEPKRVVAALVTKPKEDEGREVITSLEAGEVLVDAAEQAAKALTIPCKNPLEVREEKLKPKVTIAATVAKKAIEEDKGGLVNRMETLSEEDAEAMRELLKDASREDGMEVDVGADVAPILMREGSKKARLGSAEDVSRDAYERVPVEAFGEALLRGMGYDPAKHKTKPVFHSAVRDTHLGLGAKALLPSEKIPVGKAAAKSKATASPTAAADATMSSPTSAAVEAAATPTSKDLWPSRGLLVRVVGKTDQLRPFHGVDAVVLEVDPESKCCKIKARAPNEEKSQVLTGITLDDIETRVTKECKSVRVVRGPHKGLAVKLLERDVRRNVARVEIQGSATELPLNDVCQFMA